MSSHKYHALVDDGTEAWPSSYLRDAILKHSPKPLQTGGDENLTCGGTHPKLCVLLTTGAMNPVHLGHAAMLSRARDVLHQHGYLVAGGFLSPSHDLYAGPKAANGGHPHADAEQRVALCRLAVTGIDWLQVGTWEARRAGRWPDFPEVLDHLAGHVAGLNAEANGGGSARDVAVFYVCGTDHAKHCRFARPDRGLVVVSRAGDPRHPTDAARLVFGAAFAPGDAGVDALSSTGVREACGSGDGARLRRMLHDGVAARIVRDGLYGWNRVEVSANAVDRTVYISASALARAWRKAEAESTDALADLTARCDAALFFFGSKRSWLFPNNAAERNESRRQGSYEPPSFPAGLTGLIYAKESRTPSQVYFLKPPDLAYGGFGSGCHPPDPSAPVFRGASEWLERHGLEPLVLERDWWLGDGYGSRGSRTGIKGRAVVDNYEIGEHDYNSCIELLAQSNPTLDPVL